MYPSDAMMNPEPRPRGLGLGAEAARHRALLGGDVHDGGLTPATATQSTAADVEGAGWRGRAVQSCRAADSVNAPTVNRAEERAGQESDRGAP
jgi:hypothetical protein